MALSEKEKDWLERREKYLKLYCQHCQFFEPYDTPHVNPGWCSGDCWCCPVVGKDILYSFQDAAEFEARVAANLAIDRANGKHLRLKGCSWYKITKNRHLVRKTACPPHHDIDNCPGLAMCSIYHARIAAEAEMDRKS